MAHAKLIWQGYKIKKALNKVKRAKLNAERARQGLPPWRPWYEQCFVNFLSCMRETICLAFCPCCIYEAHRTKVREKTSKSAFGRLLIDGTYENDILKHFIGFFAGLSLSMLFFLLLIYQLEYKWIVATPIAGTLGLILSIGLAFSTPVRCIVILMLPQLFTSRGRAFITAYIFILILGGPAKNFAHNTQVLSASVTCGQDAVYKVTKAAVRAALAPIFDIRDAIRNVIQTLKDLANKLQQAFIDMKKCFEEVGAAIGRAFAWLDNAVVKCNENMSSPYVKCMDAFNKAVKECRETLGIMKFLCEIPNGIKHVCHVARLGELLCKLTEKVRRFFHKHVTSNINKAIHDVREMFYFNVTFVHRYEHSFEQTKSYDEIRRDIMAEINARLNFFTDLIFWTNSLLILMFIWLFISAINYRRKYLQKERFDNYYITFALRDANERREEMGKETVLPLKRKEAKKYIKPSSLRLAKFERRRLITGIIFLAGSMIHAGFYLLMDFMTYDNLWTVRKHLELKVHDDVPHHLSMHVEGRGFLALVYRLLITVFDPLGRHKVSVDTTVCLPNPSVPDWYIYKTVGGLYAVCLFLTLTEAYGLRLRHMICACYYPRRDMERSVWLYNHILRRRGGWFKFMRRRMRHQLGGGKGEEVITWKSRLAARCYCCERFLKWWGYNKKYCFCCGQPGAPEDRENFMHCAKADCKAIYCLSCFMSLNNLCTLCMDPIDYGDFSDLSEEVDSSDEEQVNRKFRRERILRDRKFQMKSRSRVSSSGSDDTDDESDRSNVQESESGAESDQSDNYNYSHHRSKKELISMNVYDDAGSDYSGSDYSDWEYGDEPEYMRMERGDHPTDEMRDENSSRRKE